MDLLNKTKNRVLEILDKDLTYPKTRHRVLEYIEKNNITTSIEYDEFVDIVMPTFNRLRETKRCIKNLYETLTINFRLIIVDNNSSEEMKEYLKNLASTQDNIELILMEENLGGGGSRMKGLKKVKSKFVAFLDNDIFVMPGYFENMITTLKDSEFIGVQSKVIQPDSLIQINRPYYEISDRWVIFYDKDIEKPFDDKSTEVQEEVAWIPAGATLWKTEIFKNQGFDIEMGTMYEDNDFSYRLNKEGYKFSNCPNALCIHYNSNFAPDTTNTYKEERFSNEKILNSAKLFYKKHGLYFSYGEPEKFSKYIGFKNKQEYLKFINNL